MLRLVPSQYQKKTMILIPAKLDAIKRVPKNELLGLEIISITVKCYVR